ncbi:MULTISPECIES: DEAD/DEAH box helicase [Dyella]|uniref:DEAD/DEAH box helicase n=2 Tax=Dyella TaxID=231454 RepID=A0A4R0YUB7_9GAMM|nr:MULTISPECIES: DEAD/DEAH box helicase family protein [Dyella]TBR39398.1 DEAD/DEAH box helicase [Dyella terrae]TCI13015.1 DEAD/DEAH box helicase [Dyella soli]
MDFFNTHADAFTIRTSSSPNTGLRPGQVGALYAIAAHFMTSEEGAIASLPTGYGKTSVMMGACFMLKARRVLVVVPTNALRNQATKAFRALDVLFSRGLIDQNALPQRPTVVALEARMNDASDWDALAHADVVVATPNLVSPAVRGVNPPPSDFFDLVLVDEGHHSPAATWAALLAHLRARHVLLSATPFRRDRLSLPGKLIFYYPLRKAVAENAFSRVDFISVPVEEGANRNAVDSALIAAAVQVYRRDRDAQLDHRLLIRTDAIQKAKVLAEQYRAAGVRVEAVSSHLTRRNISGIEQRLLSGELDGVVCVDMFGEGYDFPKFKIAVLHAAHRTLVPTLQFIGRFARTNDQGTGAATFLAAPSDLRSESNELFREGVDWSIMLADIADARQHQLIEEREVLRDFEPVVELASNYEAISPSILRLPFHVAMYKAGFAPDLRDLPGVIASQRVVMSWRTNDELACILLTRSLQPPAWCATEDLVDITHECYLLRYFPESELLFVAATLRSARSYSDLVEHYLDGEAKKLGFHQARRVLNGLQGQEFFSVGMRSTSPVRSTESYRILAGAQTDRNIRDNDAATYTQGHFYGRGYDQNGSQELIGASAGGRAWSNGKDSIDKVLRWMVSLHNRITAEQLVIGRSGLDRLPVGEPLELIPVDTCSADWGIDTYRVGPRARWQRGDDHIVVNLLDCGLQVVDVSPDQACLSVDLVYENWSCRLTFSPSISPSYFTTIRDAGAELYVESREHEYTPIADWLEADPLTFFTKDLSSFSEGTLTRTLGRAILREDALAPRDWNGCDIQVEFDTANPARQTVQRFLQDQLLASQPTFLIFDHRSGEAADFILGRLLANGRLLIELHHCKGAGGVPSAGRVDDVYELAGQAVKSVRFLNREQLERHITRRTAPRAGGGFSTFLVGDRDETIDLIQQIEPIDVELTIFAVQPGLSAAALNRDDEVINVKQIMAAANDGVAAQQAKLIWTVSH